MNGFPKLFEPEMLRDPYPVYARMRKLDAVHWEESLQVWIVSRYADIALALHDPRLSSDRIGSLEQLERMGLKRVIPIFQTLSRMMLFSNPPRHTCLRGLVKTAFTPRFVQEMATDIQKIVKGLLDKLDLSVPTDTATAPRPRAAGKKVTAKRTPRPVIDLMRQLAFPLPSMVAGKMFGIARKDAELFRKWWYDVMRFLKEVYTLPEQEHEAALRAVSELTEYVRDVLTRRRKQRGDDLLSLLANSERDGRKLSDEEVFSNAILLLSVGQESVTNLIGNGMLALLRHPDQWRLLKRRPDLMENAVEEFLRYDSPIQFTGRRADGDLEIGGRKIQRGQHVMLLLGSANRDPERFADPDRLDIERRDIRHFSFAHGPHFCLGAQLARLEGKTAFEALAGRFPRMDLVEEPLEWRPTFSSRGLVELPVRI